MNLSISVCATDSIDEELHKKLCALLPKERGERFSKIERPAANNSIVAAYGLLRYALLLTGVPEIPEVAYMERGKPYFPSLPGFHFSLSHTRGFAACAVADSEIGCDIETRREPYEATARKVFSPEEYEWWGRQENRADAFLMLWTLKEAAGKLTGEGIHFGQPDFDMNGEKPRHLMDGVFTRSFETDDYRLSVCAMEPIEIKPVEIPAIILTI